MIINKVHALFSRQQCYLLEVIIAIVGVVLLTAPTAMAANNSLYSEKTYRFEVSSEASSYFGDQTGAYPIINGVTLSWDKSTGTSVPAYNSTYNEMRFYANNEFTLSIEGNEVGNLLKLQFVISAQGLRRATTLLASSGTVTYDYSNSLVTWEGNTPNVTFKVGEKSTYGSDGETKAGQFCFTSVLLSYEDLNNSSSTTTKIPSGIYLRGTMNGWGYDESTEFFYVDDDNSTIYLSNVSISASDEFRIADSSWSEIDYGLWVPDGIELNQAYTLTPRGSNMYLAEDATNVDIKFDLNSCQFIIGYNLVPGGPSSGGDDPIVPVEIKSPQVVPQSCNFYEPITVTMSAEAGLKIYYMIGTPSASGTTNSQAVYFSDTDNWGGSIYCYSWSNNGGNEYGGSWPGSLCTKLEDGVWEWQYTGKETIPDGNAGVIFNNRYYQTDDMVWYNGGLYNAYGYTGDKYSGVGSATLDWGSEAWIEYTAPITVKKSTSFKVKAVDAEGNESKIIQVDYKLNHPSPDFTPKATDFYDPINVSISAVAGETIYYTLDGSNPSQSNGTVYVTPIRIESTTTIKAIAVNADGDVSPASSATYRCTKHGIGEDFNPSSPPDPNASDVSKKYNLVVVANPSGAGYTNYDGKNKLSQGETISLRAYTYSNFNFVNWTIDGEVVSTSSSYNYTMPDSDVAIIANYAYNPESPSDPNEPTLTHPVTVVAKPAGAGYFNFSSTSLQDGKSIDVYAYTNTNFRFKGWKVDGQEIAQTTSPLIVTMNGKPISVTGLFEYYPSSPSNPGANYWNPNSGQLIVDDFDAGNLYSTISNLVGYNNFGNIASIIIKGRVNNNDFSGMANSSYTNLSSLDITRIDGVNAIPSYAFEYCPANSIYLPASITSLGSYCFYGCENLNSLSVYATVPPTASSNTFSNFTNKANCIVRVPTESISLYEKAPYWSQFTIMPLAEELHAIQVSLPEECADGRYKNNRIELVNTATGSRQKYVVTDRLAYTFIGLQKDEQFNIYLLSQTGLEIGRIEDLMVQNADIYVSFENLKSLKETSAKVFDADNKDVTSSVTVEWLEPKADGTTVYLRKAASIGEVPVGQKLICRITLPQNLGTKYANPDDIAYTVSENSSTLNVNLEPLRIVSLTGSVVDENGAALGDASISVNALMNGKYSVTSTAKTDRNGKWSVSLLDAPEYRLTYAAPECINVLDTIPALDAEVSAVTLDPVKMRSIASARINYSFTYTPAAKTGEEVETSEYYSNAQNVNFYVFNVTQNREHREISVQNSTIVVLDENVNEGDIIKVTAKSTDKSFSDIVEETTIQDQKGEVLFDIYGLGGIEARFAMTENPAVIAMLYNKNGNLISTAQYTEAVAKFLDLADGNYSLVSIGKSNLLNAVQRLQMLSDVGLVNGTDYVLNNFTVEEGVITEITNELIPPFDENRFRYTSSVTSFSLNKSSVTPGNYLTLKSNIDFKTLYKNGVSDIKMIYDLPETCALVENSVMQGKDLIPYSVNGTQVIVPLPNLGYTESVRFVIVPTEGSNISPNASVSFNFDGQTYLQPIGSVLCYVKDLEIVVPETVRRSQFSVSGLAPFNSTILVYDDTQLIGQGKALANGQWIVECELSNPYNLSIHPIYAIATTKDNVDIKTNTIECRYDAYTIEVDKVTMITNGTEIVFDFQNPSSGVKSYTPGSSYTFTIDFTDNNPELISDVVLYVKTSDGKHHRQVASFDESLNKWVALYSPNIGDAVNVSLDYYFINEFIVDRRLLTDNCDLVNSYVIESINERDLLYTDFVKDEDVDNQFVELESALDDETTSLETLNYLLNNIHIVSSAYNPEEVSIESMIIRASDLENWYNNWKEIESEPQFKDYLYSLYIENDFNIPEVFSSSIEVGNNIKNISITHYSEEPVIDFNNCGYESYSLTDNSIIYFRFDYNLIDIVDISQDKHYMISISDISDVSDKLRPYKVNQNFFGYLECGQKVVSTIQSLSSIASNNGDDRKRWMSIIKGIGEILNLTQCYYSGYRAAFEYNINEAYNRGTKEIVDKLNESNRDLDYWTDLLNKQNHEIDRLSGEQHSLIELRESVINDHSLSVDEKNFMLSSIEKDLDNVIDKKLLLLEQRKSTASNLKKVKSVVQNLTKRLNAFKSVRSRILENFAKLPPRLAKGIKMPKWLKVSGKLAGEFGIMLQVAGLYLDAVDIYDELCEWIDLVDAIDKKLPCEANEDQAQNLKKRIYNSADGNFRNGMSILSCETAAIGFSAAGGIPVLSPTWWAESLINIGCEWGKMFNYNASLNLRGQYWLELYNLKCKKDCGEPGMPPCPDDDGGGGNNGGGNNGNGNNGGGGQHQSGNGDATPIRDPGGYVYEAVPSHRVEGVQTTCYYKEIVEDMYGDLVENVVLWNAEEYAQSNPLFTDENGLYNWDVPDGLWQVKYEKDGYLTAQSEWLPVPPPQLEVHVGITQNKQPEIVDAHAYETGIQVQFDKYMDPTTVNNSTMFLTVSGNRVDGEIVTLDEEISDPFASADDTSVPRYARVFRFIPEQTLSMSQGEIRFTVSREVKSYAGIPMQANFSQLFDIEKEITEITTDDPIQVLYGGDKTITVDVIPFDASVGKILKISNSSPSLLTVENDEVEIDENGQAQVHVIGDLPGQAMLTFSVDGAYNTGEAQINIVTELYDVDKPVASRASGTQVYRGTKITLSTEAPNATIYYTTDGSCPCDENGTRMRYILPIEITGDTAIKALVVTSNNEESETAEFNYSLKMNDLDYNMAEGWTWISHNLDANVPTSEVSALAEVNSIVAQDSEVVRDPQLGLVGNLSQLLPGEAYKVEASSDSETLRLTDFARDPSKPIQVMKGWNWLGYTSGQTMSVAEAFEPTDVVENDYIVGQKGFAQYNGSEWIGTLETMVPGVGYLFNSQNDKKIVYNSSIVSNAASIHAFALPMSAPWAVDINKYPQIMCFVASLVDKDNNPIDANDYYVGAFNGTECRGIGKVVNGMLLMSIYGKPNDLIEFNAVRVGEDASYRLQDTFNFSETMIGNVNEPYALSIDASESSIANINADTSWTIRLEDRKLYIEGANLNEVKNVSLINMDGMRVISTSTVNEGGISLSSVPAGIYAVVILDNNGYSYYKILVK